MHPRKMWLRVITPVVFSAMFGGDSASALPDDRWAEYTVYETPSDPQSDVVFIVRLHLVADQQITGQGTEGSVGWDVTGIDFTQPGTPSDTLWTEASPSVDTPDGLWWVGHADLGNPDAAEFALPPSLVGTATADDPADEDLDYDLVGEVYTPPAAPEEPPHEITGSLTFDSYLATSQAEVEEGDDEPIRIGGGFE